MDYLWLILSLLVAVSIGWSLLSLIFYKRPLLFLGERLALSYAIGLGVISVEMALLSLCGIKFSMAAILIWWIPVFLASGLIDLKNSVSRPERLIKKEKGLTALEGFFIFGISFEVLYAFFRAMIRPIESYDAIAIYAIKAKIFYLAKAIPQDLFTSLKDFVPHAEYPLLLPLSETYVYTFLGSMNDLLVKVLFPLYYLACLAVFYYMARRMLRRKHALLFTFLLATVPQFTDYATNGYADLILAFYYSASIFYMVLWMKMKETPFLILSFVLSALGVWTKTEGLMLAFVNIMVMAAYIATEGKRESRLGISYMAALAALAALYLCAKRMLGLELHSDFGRSGPSGLWGVFGHIKRIPSILYEYQIQFFGPKRWNIIWIILIFGFIVNFKRSFSHDLKPLTLALLLTLCGYTLVYLALPAPDISWNLSTTASRFFIHFLPVAALWLAATFKDRDLDI